MNSGSNGDWISIFIIMGKNFNPDHFIDTFMLDISESWNKDQVDPKTGKSYNYGSITFDISKDIRGRDLESHLRYWIDSLEKHRDDLVKLRQFGCDIFIECWISSEKIEGVTLDLVLLKGLAQLSVDLEIRFYPGQSEE